MKLFKRIRRQSGYCTISEPVSDLSPEVISAIKANSDGQTNNIKSISQSSFQDNPESDEITESITLTPTPSESSSPPESSQSCKSSTIRQEKIKKDDGCEKNCLQSKKISCTHPSTKSTHSEEAKSCSKTPLQSSLVKGLKDCLTTTEITKSIEAPTERLDLFNLQGTSHTNRKKEVDFSFTSSDKKESNELDKTFDPDIISVNSDVTEPTYETLEASTGCEHRWKKITLGEMRLSDILGTGEKSQTSIFDFLVDALCEYPNDDKRRRS